MKREEAMEMIKYLTEEEKQMVLDYINELLEEQKAEQQK